MRAYLQPAFVICVVVLAAAGGVMSKFHIEQEPWPLKKPLTLLDQSDLGPYRIVEKAVIDDKDILDALGTEDYIQWVLEDVEAADDSPVCRVVLFVTYYALADRVPHVPEECYAGRGYKSPESDAMKLAVSQISTKQKVPGTHLVFQKTGSIVADERFSAFYLFNVSGTYAAGRNSVRLALNKNMFAKHSYFSKVEWFFLTSSGVRSYLEGDEATKAGEKLLAVILPILESEHWPKENTEAGSG